MIITDRTTLKEKAKNIISAFRLEAIVITLIMTIATGLSGFSANINPSVIFNNSGDGFGGEYTIDAIFSQFGSFFAFGSVFFSIAFFLVKYLLLNILNIGGYRFFLKVAKNERSGIGEVTGNFRDGNYGNIALIQFLRDIFNSLWFLLFIIPGIVKYYEYYMISFILAVRPDIDRKEAFRLSKTLMDGHKMDLFILHLSFIGWGILNLFTCGILSIVYVNPYIKATEAEFFYAVREDAIMRGAVYEQELPSYGMFINNGFNNEA